MNRYQEYCNEYEAVEIELPEKGTILKYKNYHRLEKVPFIVYANFESYIKLLQSCEPNPESSYTKQYKKYEPSSLCYYIKCFDDEVYEPKINKLYGKDAVQKFVETLGDIRKITSIPDKKMIFEKAEAERFNKETRCWICSEKFTGDVKNCKVRDHCHFTGRYRSCL